MAGDIEKEISAVVYDSRKIRGGEVFVAVKGERFDGNSFIEDAIKQGAAAVVYGKDRQASSVRRQALTDENNNSAVDAARSTLDAPRLLEQYPGVAWIGVDDPRDALAWIANAFYGRPSGEMTVIGITGTNGKTTTSYLVRAILERWEQGVGLVGTISYMIRDMSYDAPHTTPESADFQALLREMSDNGCAYVVSEVSSHALSQKRVEYTRFKAGIFTNLTRDHLDFHKTMEDYYRAKERLFTGLLADGGCAAVNTDDPYGIRLVETLRKQRPDIRVLTYSLADPGADITARDIQTTFKGTSFTITAGGEEHAIFSPLVGSTNVYNVLSAICTALLLDIPITIVKEGIAMTGLVQGRFEKVDMGQDFLAVVDYAHTEDALERLLLTARQLLEAYRFAAKTEKIMKAKRRKFAMPDDKGKEHGKIITVVGCGGNRDKGKRSKMGEIAAKLSDFVIITSDNPRYEDPKAIIKDVEKGIKSDNYIVIPDRSVAISMAVELASSGDIVLVAGKGHENYQEVQGVRYQFSDRNVLESAIKRTTSRPAFGGGAAYSGVYPQQQGGN